MAKDFAQAFYHSGLWKMKRMEIMRRDKRTCKLCGTARATEVHHIQELTPSNINDPLICFGNDNLIAVCGECHKRVTRQSKAQPCAYIFDEEGMITPYPPEG